MAEPPSLFSVTCASAQAVAFVLEVIISRGGDLLYDHYLRDREVPHSASRVLGSLARVVGAVYLQGDGEHEGPDGTRALARMCMCAPPGDGLLMGRCVEGGWPE